MSEEAEVGTLVGTIMAAAVNQTIIYSIVEGNEGGEWAGITAVSFQLSWSWGCASLRVTRPDFEIKAFASSMCFQESSL